MIQRRLLDLLWLALLGIFVFAGMPITSFHGDETYHIFNSNDYAILFIQHRPQDLLVHSLWESNLGYHRLLDSGVSRYTIGFAWQLAGMTQDDLPDAGYDWSGNYDDNLARGLVPLPSALYVYRIPSTLFTILSVAVVFLISKLYGGRPLAYFTSALYTLNPVILLNGRRALQEGSLLFFGLLTIYLALRIARQREAGLPVRQRLWAGLIVAGALTLYSKNSGFVYTIAAYLAIFVPELLRFRWRSLLAISARLVVCTALTLLLFFVLSPGLWFDPLARIQDVIFARVDAIRVQVDVDPNAPTTLEQRVADIITESFMRPLQHYELAPVRESLAQDVQIEEYMLSPLSGLQFGLILGGLLTLLAFYGLLVNAVPSLRLNRSWALAIGLYLWLAVNIALLLDNPLPWQRYFLSLIPVMTLFCGLTVSSLVQLGRRAAVMQLRCA